jgi:hypothetical protein
VILAQLKAFPWQAKWSYAMASDQLRSTAAFQAAAVSICPDIICEIDSHAPSFLDIAVLACQKQVNTAMLPQALQDDKAFVMRVAASTQAVSNVFHNFRDDKSVMLAAVASNSQNFSYVSDRLRDDNDVVIKAIEQQVGWLNSASDRIQKKVLALLTFEERASLLHFDNYFKTNSVLSPQLLAKIKMAL